MPQDVVRRLVDALEDGERVGPDGLPEIQEEYRVDLTPRPGLPPPPLPGPGQPASVKLLTHWSSGWPCEPEPPFVVLQSQPALPTRAVDIRAASRARTQRPCSTTIETGLTQDLPLGKLRDNAVAGPDGFAPRAYLIVKGDRTYDLTESVVRIGRALDNDLILEDRQVSRYHAVLRHRYGRYILQDLNSTGGTTVNGFVVREIVLRPGDLISLSGVDLIYAESEPLERASRGHTQPLAPQSG